MATYDEGMREGVDLTRTSTFLRTRWRMFFCVGSMSASLLAARSGASLAL